MAFQPGYNKGATFQPVSTELAINGGSVPTAAITGHSWSEAIDALDVTHSGTAGIQALLAGILRGDGNVKCNFDSSAILWLAAGGSVFAGSTGIIRFYIGAPNNPFSVPCLVIKLNMKSEVAGKVELDFDVRLNYLAGSYVRAG